MYLLKFENDMGYDGGVTTIICGISKDKEFLENLAKDLDNSINEFNKKWEEIANKLNNLNKSNFKSLSFGQIPFEEREKMRINAETEKDNLMKKYPLVIEYENVYNCYYESNQRNEFIIENVKIIK